MLICSSCVFVWARHCFCLCCNTSALVQLMELGDVLISGTGAYFCLLEACVHLEIAYNCTIFWQPAWFSLQSTATWRAFILLTMTVAVVSSPWLMVWNKRSTWTPVVCLIAWQMASHLNLGAQYNSNLIQSVSFAIGRQHGHSPCLVICSHEPIFVTNFDGGWRI